MDDTIFLATDAAIAKAHGSRDPEVVADYNNILIGDPLSGTIVGMAMRFAYLGSVAVNGKLEEVWRLFALWHELAHVFRNGQVLPRPYKYQEARNVLHRPSKLLLRVGTPGFTVREAKNWR